VTKFCKNGFPPPFEPFNCNKSEFCLLFCCCAGIDGVVLKLRSKISSAVGFSATGIFSFNGLDNGVCFCLR
jgi:hypothetical protein